MPGTEVTKQEVDRLSDDVRQLAGSVENQVKASHELAQSVTETTTVMRQFIGEQRGRNQRVDRLLEEHGKQIGDLEKWQAGIDASLPTKLIDGVEIDKRLNRHGTMISNLQKFSWRLAGAIAVIVLIIEVGSKFFTG